MLIVTCDCGKRFQVSDQEAGKRGACPCGQVVPIPGPPVSETVSLAGLEYEISFSREASASRERPSDGPGSPRAGDSTGPYTLVRKLGQGAMGEVWLARDEHLEREVAIKFLHAHVSCDQDQLRRFMREAKLMAKLDHPHVVRVVHLGDTGDRLYLVIEYVRGGSLEDHVRKTGPLPWREATRAIRDAASGLAEAHRQELIHRDIKPANLLRTSSGETKVTDFGLARRLTQGSELTQLGTVMGSPHFMAPEQWEGKPADERTDLYGLTCSYYYLLTGKPPFQADTWEALIYQHLHAPLPDVRRALPTIPEGVGRILRRGSQKDPDKRYQSASELLADLQQLLGPEMAPDTVAPTSRLARASAGLLAVILLALAGLSWPLIRPQLHPSPRPTADNAAGSGIDRAMDARDSTGDGTPTDDIADTSGDANSAAPSPLAPITLDPLPAVFELRVIPDDAEVFVEGGDARVRGQRSPRRIEVQQPVVGNELQIVVRQEGFSEWRTTWRPIPGAIEHGIAELTQSELSLPSMITNSIGMTLALIPAGEFQMGSPDDEPERNENEVLHPVQINRPFYMGVTEVTQQQYQRVMGMNPSWFSPSRGGSNLVAGLDTSQFPVESVSWDDAVEFCKKLSALPEEHAAGRVYRLPTEAEWEYACRAGTTTPFHFGSHLNGDEANCDGTLPYGTTVEGPYLRRPTKVGSYAANAFGLYDMHGNVWERCADRYGDDPATMVQDPQGAQSGSTRVIRGGSWDAGARSLRSAYRSWRLPESRYRDLGFRVALNPLGLDAEGPAR